MKGCAENVNLLITTVPKRYALPSRTAHVSFRDTGCNMAWFSPTGIDGSWIETAVGTSYECDQSVDELWFVTQTGFTQISLVAVPGGG